MTDRPVLKDDPKIVVTDEMVRAANRFLEDKLRFQTQDGYDLRPYAIKAIYRIMERVRRRSERTSLEGARSGE